jgi:uncharacterized membrane protein YfcA
LNFDPVLYTVAAFGVVLVGYSKAGFGGGLGFLGVLMMSVVATPVQAVAVMLPVLCVLDMALSPKVGPPLRDHPDDRRDHRNHHRRADIFAAQ